MFRNHHYLNAQKAPVAVAVAVAAAAALAAAAAPGPAEPPPPSLPPQTERWGRPQW